MEGFDHHWHESLGSQPIGDALVLALFHGYPRRGQDGATTAPSRSLKLTQRPEAFAHVVHQRLRLLPRSEVRALGMLPIVDQVGIGRFRPLLWDRTDLLREDTDHDRDPDAARSEEGVLVLPVKPGRRYTRPHQPK